MAKKQEEKLPHLGQLVQKVLVEQRETATGLGRKLGMSANNMSDMMGRHTMQAHLLWRIGKALDYDFFAHLCGHADPVDATAERVRDLEAMMEALEKEVAYLREINALLKKG